VGWMFKVHRGLVTERTVEPLSVVVSFDGLKDGLASLVFVLEMAIEQEFVFESAPEGFHGSVVVAIGFAAHTRLDSSGAELGAVDPTGVLATAIGMVEQPWRRLAMSQSHLESAGGKAGIEIILHGPADDFAAVEIHNAGEVEKAFSGPQVSDVTDPDLIDGRWRWSLGEPIGRDGLIVVAIGRAHSKSAAAARGQALLAHESFDGFVIAAVAAFFKQVSEARTAISAFELLKSAFNKKLEVEPVLLAQSGFALEPSVISAARKAQGAAEISEGIKW
jgi:hypothetical protein